MLGMRYCTQLHLFQILLQYGNFDLFTFSTFTISTSAKNVSGLPAAVHLITNNILYSLFVQFLVTISLDIGAIRINSVESLFSIAS